MEIVREPVLSLEVTAARSLPLWQGLLRLAGVEKQGVHTRGLLRNLGDLIVSILKFRSGDR